MRASLIGIICTILHCATSLPAGVLVGEIERMELERAEVPKRENAPTLLVDHDGQKIFTVVIDHQSKGCASRATTLYLWDGQLLEARTDSACFALDDGKKPRPHYGEEWSYERITYRIKDQRVVQKERRETNTLANIAKASPKTWQVSPRESGQLLKK